MGCCQGDADRNQDRVRAASGVAAFSAPVPRRAMPRGCESRASARRCALSARRGLRRNASRRSRGPGSGRCHVVARIDGDGFGDAAGHDEGAGRDLLAAGAQVVGQHGDGSQGVAEHGGAGGHGLDLAVDLEDDTQGAQVELVEVAHVAADDEAGRGGVVGDHALQVELEVAVAGVDDLDGRDDEVGGGHHGGDVAAGALQRGLGDDADLGFDLRVDQLGVLDLAAVGAGHVVGDEAEHRGLDAHLLHLGEGGEAALEAGDLVAAGFLAATDLVLDGVGVVPVHVGVIVGDLGDVEGLEFGVFEVLGELEDGCVIEIHGRVSF
jgi:hypothetical protein